jgi:hypothetical protein
MKLTALMLFISIATQAQVSIEAGLSSRMQGVFKANVERQTGWNNTELSVLMATDNTHPVIGLQTGYSTTNDYQQANIRFTAGAFYHTGILPVDKEVREKQIRFGGSIRYELNDGLVGFQYNGETIQLTLGFIFKGRNQ